VVALGSSSFMSNAGFILPLRSSLPTRPVVTAAPYCAPLGPVKKRHKSSCAPIATRRGTNSEITRGAYCDREKVLQVHGFDRKILIQRR
jgi:hypothetical protein